MNATRRFADWCASKDIHELAQVEPFHVAAFVHDLQEELSPPSVKQHLAAIRILFDWLVTGHVIETNPAHSVRGPRYTVKKGKTPVLTPEEAHALLESIPITKKPANDPEAADQPDLLGLRDRALIAMMVYSFARIGTVIQMKVGDYFVQGRRRWVPLHEKGGKEHDVPCHHRLDQCLHDYIEASGIADDVDGYLFRTSMKSSKLRSDLSYIRMPRSIIQAAGARKKLEPQISDLFYSRCQKDSGCLLNVTESTRLTHFGTLHPSRSRKGNQYFCPCNATGSSLDRDWRALGRRRFFSEA